MVGLVINSLGTFGIVIAVMIAGSILIPFVEKWAERRRERRR